LAEAGPGPKVVFREVPGAPARSCQFEEPPSKGRVQGVPGGESRALKHIRETGFGVVATYEHGFLHVLRSPPVTPLFFVELCAGTCRLCEGACKPGIPSMSYEITRNHLEISEVVMLCLICSTSSNTSSFWPSGLELLVRPSHEPGVVILTTQVGLLLYVMIVVLGYMGGRVYPIMISIRCGRETDLSLRLAFTLNGVSNIMFPSFLRILFPLASGFSRPLPSC
jgi:hypothetical protein